MSAVLPHVVSLVSLLALLLSALYVGGRLSTLFGWKRRLPLQLAIILMIVGLIAATVAAVSSADPTIGLIYLALGYALYLHFNLFLMLLVAQLVTRAAGISSRIAGTAALLVATGLTIAGAVEASGFRVVETEIALPRLAKEVRIMQISDLHLGHHRSRDYLARVVAETNRRKPDLVVISGDFLDSNAALQPGVLTPLASLEAPAYYVIGNHEKETNVELALRRLAESGLHIIDNQVVDTHGIQLVGLDYMNADAESFNMHPSATRATIASTLPKLVLRPDRPAVLLQHAPFGAKYAERKGIDLMLVGHTHAGQVFPFSLVTPLVFPFNHGLYREGKTAVFVSGGAGTFMVRARLGTSNELNLITLKPA